MRGAPAGTAASREAPTNLDCRCEPTWNERSLTWEPHKPGRATLRTSFEARESKLEARPLRLEEVPDDAPPLYESPPPRLNIIFDHERNEEV